MIPRFKPSLGWGELIAAFRFSRKDDVQRFEQAFAKKMQQRHAIAFPYGRTGLMLLLEAMGLKGREIICPAYTCVVVPHAIVFSGNEPVFIDCNEGDFNMDIDKASKTITDKTGAIIATSIFGYPADLDKLSEIRQMFPHIKIIQDCAHSFAAEWKGCPVHKAGDAAIFGLNISKIITSIFGGMVTTDNDELAVRLKNLRDERLKPATFMKSLRRLFYLLSVYLAFWEPIYSYVNRLERSGLLNKFVTYYDENVIDMPSDYLKMMSNVEARVGLVQLEKYDNIIRKRKEVALTWRKKLNRIKDIVLPPDVKGATYSHFVCLVKDRDAMLEEYMKKGVQLGTLIDYSIPYMKAYVKWKKGEYPISLEYSHSTVNFPVIRKAMKSYG